MVVKRFSLIVFFLVLLLLVSNVRADWANLTGAQSAPNIAEIYLEEDHVRLVLEIYNADLDTFVDLLPEDFFEEAGLAAPPLEERLKRFSEETIQFIVDDKENLHAELKLLEPRLGQGSINLFLTEHAPDSIKSSGIEPLHLLMFWV